MGVGLVGLLLVTGAAYFLVQNPLSFAIALALLGIFMSLVVINDLPLLYDIGDGSQIGALTGVYFVATQIAAVLGPTSAGVAIEVAGSHRVLFAFAAFFAFFAWLILWRVRIVRPQPESALGSRS